MEKAYFKKDIIGYLGDGGCTDALIVRHNKKTIRIAIYNLRAGRFEFRNVQPHMVAERDEERMIDRMTIDIESLK